MRAGEGVLNLGMACLSECPACGKRSGPSTRNAIARTMVGSRRPIVGMSSSREARSGLSATWRTRGYAASVPGATRPRDHQRPQSPPAARQRPLRGLYSSSGHVSNENVSARQHPSICQIFTGFGHWHLSAETERAKADRPAARSVRTTSRATSPAQAARAPGRSYPPVPRGSCPPPWGRPLRRGSLHPGPAPPRAWSRAAG
jgi:hypothetical protein